MMMMMMMVKLDPPEGHYSSSKPGDKWHLPRMCCRAPNLNKMDATVSLLSPS